MKTDLSWIQTESRLLFDVSLQPLQGGRFQPTGFPDLGVASYKSPDGTESVLVESAQSMANRLEMTIWKSAPGELIEAAKGIPYIETSVKGHRTSSVEESHRINSGYFLKELGLKLAERIKYDKDSPVNVPAFVKELLAIDPNSILHGTFLSQLHDGRLRLARLLSAFVEADNAYPAVSGGVKLDRLAPKGIHEATKEKEKASEAGLGNIVFSRTEYSAKAITAYFNLDLSLLRSYGLPEEAQRFLVVLALYKIRAVLDSGLRFRTACDLEVTGKVLAKKPSGWELPDLKTLAADLSEAIKACSSHFANPSVTKV